MQGLGRILCVAHLFLPFRGLVLCTRRGETPDMVLLMCLDALLCEGERAGCRETPSAAGAAARPSAAQHEGEVRRERRIYVFSFCAYRHPPRDLYGAGQNVPRVGKGCRVRFTQELSSGLAGAVVDTRNAVRSIVYQVMTSGMLHGTSARLTLVAHGAPRNRPSKARYPFYGREGARTDI